MTANLERPLVSLPGVFSYSFFTMATLAGSFLKEQMIRAIKNETNIEKLKELTIDLFISHVELKVMIQNLMGEKLAISTNQDNWCQ